MEAFRENLNSRLQPIIRALRFNDSRISPQIQYRINLLGLIVFGNLLSILLAWLYTLTIDFSYREEMLVLVLIGVSLNLWILSRVTNGKTVLASRLYVVSSWSFLAIISYSSGGIYSSTMMGFMTLFVTGLLLFGDRDRVILYVATILYFIYLLNVELAGNLPYAPFKDLQLRILVLISTLTTFFILVTYHLYAFHRAYTKLQHLQVVAERRDVQHALTQDLAHDLRTPLASLKTTAYLVKRRQELGQPIDKHVKRFDQQIDNINTMIEELFQLTLLDNDEPTLRREHVNLNEVISLSIDGCIALANTRNITLEAVETTGSPMFTIGDHNYIKRIFDNLIKNAILYGREGGFVKVKLITEKDGVQILVSDNGIGIPEGELDKIFDRFYRVNKARTNDAETGTGIGLNVVRQLVAIHNGKISVESKLGEGSTFTVTLPKSDAP